MTFSGIRATSLGNLGYGPKTKIGGRRIANARTKTEAEICTDCHLDKCVLDLCQSNSLACPYNQYKMDQANAESGEWLGTWQAAKRLGVTMQTVQGRIRRGELKAKWTGKKWLVPVEALR